MTVYVLLFISGRSGWYVNNTPECRNEFSNRGSPRVRKKLSEDIFSAPLVAR